jgi:hypothetical protein
MVASMNDAPVKNLAPRFPKLEMTAGMYHSKDPQMYMWAEVTKMGVKAPRVPMIGRAKNWWPPARRFLENLRTSQ